MAQGHIPQPLRYTFLIAELAALMAVNRLAYGNWFPAGDTSGLWFYAALFGLILGHRLDTPFFTTPAAAVLYAIPSLFGLFQIADSTWLAGSPLAEASRAVLAAWMILILSAASAALWLQNSSQVRLQQIALGAKQVSAALGNPRAFFSVILLLTLLAFPPPSVASVLAIVAVWAVTVPFSLLDFTFSLIRRIRLAIAVGTEAAGGAQLESFQSPGLLTVRGTRTDSLRSGAIICIRDPAAGLRVAYVLGTSGRHDGVLFRAIDLGPIEPSQNQARALQELLEDGQVAAYELEFLSEEQRQKADSLRLGSIGIVAPDSDMARLVIEVTTARDLAAGALVTTHSGQQEMYYQLSNGLTKEEIVQQKSTNGFVVAHAKSVGIWDAAEVKFKPASWVATPNASVMLVQPRNAAFQRERVGTFPGTDFAVRLKNVAQLVTHNTAILGILGVGKSTLAMELVERVIETGCKAIVLDLTDQYATELAPLIDAPYQAATIAALEALGPPGRANVRLNVEEGGSRNQFSQEVEARIEAFMNSNHKILVLNPASFEVWRQDSRPYNNTASMASLTACEITHIVSERALKVVQRRGRTDEARLCLVYEEAHSLVPEWNAAVSEGDRTATNGTSRAILQGRKYGFGCVLITQRTASVTKTILNQCNTVFAMRSFDDTSREFLSNYIGRDYASLLPNLPERHAIFFGRASSCENPVHVQLNDRTEFVDNFRVADLV